MYQSTIACSQSSPYVSQRLSWFRSWPTGSFASSCRFRASSRALTTGPRCSSKSSRLGAFQSPYLRWIYLRYQYWITRVFKTYGFMNGGEIRSSSAAKTTDWGYSNVASVNSQFCAGEVSVRWWGGAKLTKVWTKENEAVGSSNDSFNHWKYAILGLEDQNTSWYTVGLSDLWSGFLPNSISDSRLSAIFELRPGSKDGKCAMSKLLSARTKPMPLIPLWSFHSKLYMVYFGWSICKRYDWYKKHVVGNTSLAIVCNESCCTGALATSWMCLSEITMKWLFDGVASLN